MDNNNEHDIIKTVAVHEGVTYAVHGQGKETTCMHGVLELCMESSHACVCMCI